MTQGSEHTRSGGKGALSKETLYPAVPSGPPGELPRLPVALTEVMMLKEKQHFLDDVIFQQPFS